MPEIPTTNDPQASQRYFAAERNNLAWEIASRDNLSAQDENHLLNAAFAAAYHWSQVGQPVNNARADQTLAHAHAVIAQHERDAALASRALFYARRSLNFFNTNPGEDWDLAFAHAEMAFAAALGDDRHLHEYHYRQAERLGQGIADEENRKVFLEEFKKIPRA